MDDRSQPTNPKQLRITDIGPKVTPDEIVHASIALALSTSYKQLAKSVRANVLHAYATCLSADYPGTLDPLVLKQLKKAELAETLMSWVIGLSWRC